MATLHTPPLQVSGSGGIRVSASVPYAPADEWAVGPHGDLFVVRVDPLRVEHREPTGRVVVGPPLPVWERPVTDSDKRLAMDRARSRMSSVSIGGAVPSPVFPDSAWPAHLPGVAAGGLAVAPDGMLWAGREHGARQEPREYLVIGGDGTVRETVHVPAGSRVVGFGHRWVYITTPDTQGEVLSRFGWPP